MSQVLLSLIVPYYVPKKLALKLLTLLCESIRVLQTWILA